jgi:hypothetical protein
MASSAADSASSIAACTKSMASSAQALGHVGIHRGIVRSELVCLFV